MEKCNQITLVFDYDGTINDTLRIYEPAFLKCYNWLVSNKYVKEEKISKKQISGWLGMNSIDMWNSFQPDLPEKIKNAASAKIGSEMLNQIAEGNARWYEGAKKVLSKLFEDGYNMVILSNCKSAYKDKNWNSFKMYNWFSSFYDCENFGFIPKSEIIKEIEKEQQSPIIVIGDRNDDYLAAKAIGATFIGCLYGYGGQDELRRADYLANSIEQLPELISEAVQKVRN